MQISNEFFMKKNNTIFWLIIGSFFLITGWYTVCNFPIISQSISEFLINNMTVRKLNKNLTAKMKSNDLFLKDEFINLNGLYGRLSGRRQLNGIILLKNGMLANNRTTVDLESKKMQKKYQNLIELDNYVSSYGGHLIFAQFPKKNDMENKLLPAGRGSDIPQKIEKMLDSFKHEGIDVIDTLPMLSATETDIEEYFYRTDHHWKPIAAFKTYQVIMDRLKEIYPDEPYDENMMKIENWTIHEIPDQFLGSHGKRVGIYFAGLDPLQWITPNFDTALSFYNSKTKTFYAGSYENVYIREEYLKPNPDYLHTTNYAVYTGGDFPLIQSKNVKAPSSQRLLIIKDSFVRPLLTFLSVQFRQTDVIDPRHYTVNSIMEYINQTKPDIVLVGQCSDMVIHKEYFEYSGQNDDYLLDERIELQEASGNIAPEKNKNNYKTLFDCFENEKYYTVSFPEISVTAGESDGVSVALYDSLNNKIINETVIDISYCNKYGDCEWTFQAPESGSRFSKLLIYAGIRGKTNSIGIDYDDVHLFERIIE